MPITKIKLKNIKSLKNIDISFSDVSCLIGENGTGKSNIIKALKHFYDNLNESKPDFSLFDKNNPYNDYFEISVTYDLDRLLKITQNNVERQLLEQVHPFFKKVLELIFDFVDEEHQISVTLKQYKNNTQEWNIPYDVRNFLKSNFPIYFIQARQIELKDWNNLWEVIGDMSKFRETDGMYFEEQIKIMLENTFGEKFTKDLRYIQEVFKNNEVNLNPFASRQKFSQIYQLQLGGKQFKHKDENLDYFSDGMNAYNYLKILISVVGKMTQAKLKEPSIVVDEPEIGLHPKYADDLINCFIANSKSIRIIIASHSSRMVKNIMSIPHGCLYHLSLKQKYTVIRKMRGFTNIRENNIMSEKEASFYFSRCILFVEGATELELFTNTELRELFPVLWEVEVYSYDSDNVKLKLTHPNEKNTSIPYLLLLDMDKIISFQQKNKKFFMKGDSYNPLKNEMIEQKEHFYYGIKRSATLHTRNRIKGLLRKTSFEPNRYWNYIEADNFFNITKHLILKYCIQYNVYPVETTIEGTLINKSNYNIFFNWMLTQKNNNDLLDIYHFNTSAAYRTTILRLLQSGKYDTLESPDDNKINKIKKLSVREIYNKIAKNKSQKTAGWVSDYINYYFANYINNSKLPKDEKKKKFKSHFGELYDIINRLEKIIEK